MISNLEENLKKFEKLAKLKGKEEGIEQGIEIGGYKKAVEVARNLLSKGLSVKDVAEATGLTQLEVEKLKMN